jgi:biopolymer transport protein ExbD
MKLGLVVVVASGCMSPVMHFGGGKSADEAQHDQAARLMPPLLTAPGEWPGKPTLAKVRVWADDDYRAQNLHWQRTFADELAYANAVLEPMLGLHLDAEYHAWDRHAQDANLEQDLAALAARDPGEGVLAVIGLTSSLSVVTTTVEHLGYASLPGHHVVLRGYHDLEERKAFARGLRELTAEERESVLVARRAHKTAALLLHELGHNLGAAHEDEPGSIMSAMYSDRASTFSELSRAVMLATLDARLGRPHAVATASPPAHHLSVVVANTPAGITVGGDAVDDAGLDVVFAAAAAADADAELTVRSSPHLPYATVVKIVDRAKAAGLHRVTIEIAD